MTLRCALTYQPLLDRLFGADLVRSFQGIRVKLMLASLARTNTLRPLMQELAAAYEEAMQADWQRDPPFPRLIAVVQRSQIPVQAGSQEELIDIDEALGLGLLPFLPEEYRELAHIVTGPYEPFAEAGTLAQRTLPDASRLASAAMRLFGILRCGHGLGLAFNRAGGSCLSASHVTPAGSIADLYYLARPEQSGEDLCRAQERDLADGFGLLARGNAWDVESLGAAFASALTAYAHSAGGTAQLRKMVAETAQRVMELGHAADVTTLQPLASAIRKLQNAE